MVKVGNLFAEDDILEQRWPAQTSFEGVLIVRDRYSLIGREGLIGRVDADAVERTDRRVAADIGAAAPRFLGSVRLACLSLSPRAHPPSRTGRGQLGH